MATPVGRRAAGGALGALTGDYPDPGFGLPMSSGYALFDDFIHPFDKHGNDLAGDMQWQHVDIGAQSNQSDVTPSGWTEAGIHRLLTAQQAGAGVILYQSQDDTFYRYPSPGAIWACKIKLDSGLTSYELWSGFASVYSAQPRVSSNSSFVGVRALNGNLFGVVKDGATATNESTVDLGVSCVGAWRSVGFRVEGTTASPSIQFFVLNEQGSDRAIYDQIDVGSAITTNLPTTTMGPIALGIVGPTVQVGAEIDWWCLGGRVAR